MGIKGLPVLIKEIDAQNYKKKSGKRAVCSAPFSKFSGFEITVDANSKEIIKYKGFEVAVDASSMLHLLVIAYRNSGRDLKNKKGQLTSHLHGLIPKIVRFLENGMVPIFVFDGKPPDLKSDTIEERKQKQQQALQNLSKYDDSDDEGYIKNFKQTFKLTREHIEETQILLDLIGIPYINAPGEADPVHGYRPE